MWTWLAASKCVLCCSVCKSESVFNQNPSVLPGSKLCTCKQLTNVSGSMCWLSALPLLTARTHSHSLYNYLCIALGTRNMHMRFSSASTCLLSLSLSLSQSLCLSPSCAFAIWTCQFVLLCCVVPQTCAHCFPLNAVIKVSLHPFCKLMGIYLPTASFMHLQNPIKFETSWN